MFLENSRWTQEASYITCVKIKYTQKHWNVMQVHCAVHDVILNTKPAYYIAKTVFLTFFTAVNWNKWGFLFRMTLFDQ